MKLKNLIRAVVRLTGYDLIEYERHSRATDLLGGLFAAHGTSCVIDVGAHRGEYGHLLRTLGYEGEIISFEPVAANYQILERRSATDPRWHAHRLALGDRSGSAAINVTRGTVFSSLLAPNDSALEIFGDTTRIERTELVDVRRLDDILDDILPQLDRQRLFLKIDTQGYDMCVIEGARRVLHRFDGLQTELSVQPIYDGMMPMAEALATLERLGLSIAGMYPVSRDAHLRVVEFDCMLVRRAAALEPRNRWRLKEPAFVPLTRVPAHASALT